MWTCVDVIIVVGSSYNVTVNRCIMTADMEICPDIVSHSFQANATSFDKTVLQRCTEIRWSVTPRYRSQMKSWTYLRFAVMTDLTKFAREVFAAFDAITAKRQLIDNRVYDIAYDSPSNFTKYCREYLGDDYFDDLREDSDDEMYESDGGR